MLAQHGYRFDGINRPTSVVQAGGANTTSQYLADQTLISDAAGAAKLDTADRDGNLVAVVEDPASWKGGTLSGTLDNGTLYAPAGEENGSYTNLKPLWRLAVLHCRWGVHAVADQAGADFRDRDRAAL